MNVLLRYRTCEITFNEADPFYSGKTVELQGEAFDDVTFHFYKSGKMYWTVPSSENPNRCIGISIDGAEKEKLLSYITEKGQEIGFNFIPW